MKALPEIISVLTKDEIRNYKLFINRTDHGDARKDEQLFDLIKLYYPKKYNEDKIFEKIYNPGPKNAFYRLKNKILQDVGLSLTYFYADSTSEQMVLNDITLAKVFAQKNAWGLVLYYLQRAEKRAKDVQLLEYLDVVYTDLIKLSQELLELDPELYITKRSDNRKQLEELRQLDDVLAVAIYKIRKTQNFGAEDTQINKLLEKTIQQYAGKIHLQKNTNLRLRIYHAISRILLSRQDYKALEVYLLKTYHDFNKEHIFTKDNHDTKLQMLTYISNSFFKNKKYTQSLEYAATLEKELDKYDKLLYNKYIFFYYNILVNNYSVIDVDKAIAILHNSVENKSIQNQPMYLGFSYINLSVSYFDTFQPKQALKYLIKRTQMSDYNSLDEALRYKIAIAELIIRYELGDYDYMESKVKQLKNIFAKKYTDSSYVYDKEFVLLINKLARMVKDEMMNESNTAVAKSINLFLTKHKKNNSPTEIINYSKWLKYKVKQFQKPSTKK